MQDTDPTIQPECAEPDIASWLRLALTPGVGPRTAAALTERFGAPASIFNASHAALAELAGARIARALLAPLPPVLSATRDAALDWAGAPGNAILTPGHAAYPYALRQLPDPPVVLYIKGRGELLAEPDLAIVGSRNGSIDGERNARAFARAISECGITIVSGLALGIDTAAHEGALAGSGSTVAVIGTGPDIVYPARNRALAHRIAQEGCILSEHPPGTPVRADHFPRRNRIISGLSQAVLVVEAAAQSGSLITAHYAAEQGRDVFAIPGSIHAALSKGCHALIKQGAKLVESANDILLEMNRNPCVPNAPQMFVHSNMHMQLLGVLDGGISDPYAIAGRTGYAPEFVITQLLMLELDGHVERLPGNMFRRLGPGG
ncbi:DNA-processing protein DprA [Pseudoduganella sp. GCM10020061]|uniref:DNA-processing protein DprA n=1 Tax=Pseudoduganella sp. GCM10020061 TaxID=3317345 RepID=UPI00363A2B00